MGNELQDGKTMRVMRTSSLLIAASLLCSAGAASPRWSAREGQDPNPPFSLTISAQPGVFTVGLPIPINVVLTNTSSHQISLLELNWCSCTAEIRDSQGALVKAKPLVDKLPDGRVLVRHAASSAMTVLVDPGKTANDGCPFYDLADEYELARPGKYSVQVLRYDDEDKIWVRSNTISIVELPKQAAETTVVIKDTSGAFLPWAKVEYKSPEAYDYGLVYACADSAGTTTLDLKPGNYDLRVSSLGFRTLTKHLEVAAGLSQTVELVLEVGSCSNCVAVISLAPAFQITDPSLSVPDYSNRPIQFEEAFQHYEDAVTAHPSNAGLHNSLGLAYAEHGQYPQARAEFRKAAELDPAGATHAYFNLGAISYFPLVDEAIEYFRKAIELDPANAEAYQELGTSLMRKANIVKDGRQLPPPETVRALETYLKLRPEGQFAQWDRRIINEGLPVSPPNPCAR